MFVSIHAQQVPPEFPGAVAGKLREIAEQGRSLPGLDGPPRHAALLDVLATEIEALSRAGHAQTDPRFYALFSASGRRTSWEPGPEQRVLLHRLGTHFPGTEHRGFAGPESLLTELAALAVDEVRVSMEGLLKQAHDQRDAAVATSEKAQLFETKLIEAQDRVEALERERTALRDQVSRLEGQLRYYAELFAGERPPDKPKKTTKPVAA